MPKNYHNNKLQNDPTETNSSCFARLRGLLVFCNTRNRCGAHTRDNFFAFFQFSMSSRVQILLFFCVFRLLSSLRVNKTSSSLDDTLSDHSAFNVSSWNASTLNASTLNASTFVSDAAYVNHFDSNLQFGNSTFTDMATRLHNGNKHCYHKMVKLIMNIGPIFYVD